MKVVQMSEVSESSPKTQAEKIAAIKGEIVSSLEDRIEELRRETEKVHGAAEQVLFRIGRDGFKMKLEDLRSGRFYRLANDVKTLQEVLAIIESHE